MHTSKDDLEPTILGDYEGRSFDTDGGLRVAFEKMPANFPPDPEALFQGLPDDHCQCPHWGYVISGSFRASYSDGSEEIVGAGEAYYMRPGHIFQAVEPVELIEFSPIAEHDLTLAHFAEKMSEAPA